MQIRFLLLLSLGLNLILIGAAGALYFTRSEIVSPRPQVEASTQASPQPLATSSPESRSLVATRPLEESPNALPATRVDSGSSVVSSEAGPTTRGSVTSSQTTTSGPSRLPITHTPSATSSSVSPSSSGGSSQTYASGPSAGSVGSSVYGGSPVSASSGGGNRAVDEIVPAVLVEGDPATPITTEEQATAWQKMQDDFIDQVGGTTQNLQDPATRAAWNEAQAESDALFKAKFGWQAFLSQNAEAGRQRKL